MAVNAKSNYEARIPAVLGDDFFAVHAAIAASLGFAVSMLWALTDSGYFWPVWVWFGLGVLFSLHWLIRRTYLRSTDLLAAPDSDWKRVELTLRFKVPLMLWTCVLLGVIWWLSGSGTLWPRWPWFALLFTAGVEVFALNVLRGRRESQREEQLTERIGELTRTRRGALEVQAEELRRVERDLHDGAQSRLVALSMQLGRAEEKLKDQPDSAEAAALLQEARAEASAAIAELRDIARGIAPPVLADRGLEAAVRSLATRATGPVEIEARLPHRPAAVLETAAYFVIAEAMTNAAKHAPGAALSVKLNLDAERLLVRIADDGPGGAVATGGGLEGLRQRVQALDGALRVDSPPGLGTTITATFPLTGG